LAERFDDMRLKYKSEYYIITGVDVGGGCRGCAPPPLPEMRPSSYSLLKFVYLISQLHHSLVMHSLLRKILDLPHY